MLEQFDNEHDWTYAAIVEGGCGVRQRGDTLWAENWEGRNCGEYYPSKQEGYLNFS